MYSAARLASTRDSRLAPRVAGLTANVVGGAQHHPLLFDVVCDLAQEGGQTSSGKLELPPHAVDNGAGENVKVKDLIKTVEADGWEQVRMRGSHRQFKHPKKPGTITVAGKPSVEMPTGTLNSVLKQAGLKDRGT